MKPSVWTKEAEFVLHTCDPKLSVTVLYRFNNAGVKEYAYRLSQYLRNGDLSGTISLPNQPDRPAGKALNPAAASHADDVAGLVEQALTYIEENR